MNRSDFLIQTVADYGAFLAEMESTSDNMQYMNRVYRMLIDMEPGSRIEIDRIVSSANLRKFIGCVCLYFWDSGENKIEFDGEYKIIKKINPNFISLQNQESHDKV